jgi:glycosyltransferase involved in cell wall biosynthesis
MSANRGSQRPLRAGITLTAPYAEGAILAIARSAAALGRLDRFCTTLYWGGQTSTRLLRGRLARRRLVGIPDGSVWQAARPSELARVTASTFSAQRVATDLMYRTKERFDHATARELRRSQSGVVVGMYAAALETFAVAQDQGLVAALHFVNSHPRIHNELLEASGAPRSSSEYVPERIARRVERELALADVVLVPSRFVADQLTAQGIPSERVVLIRYGVDPVLFAPSRKPTRTTGKLKFLYVGQISWRKGIPVLVEAARMLQGFGTYTLVGPLVSPQVVSDLPPNLTVKKTLPHAQLRTEYNSADAFVLPSIEDAFPLVTLEALSSGLPVVVSLGAGTSELITHALDGLLVPAGDASALGDALLELADPAFRAELGRAGRKLVERAYSWSDYGGRVLSTLDRSRVGS